MAHSRLDRIGTIFSRITSLIRGGTMKEHNIPLWYMVYKTFPPKYEPRYDRPPSDKPIRQIFYEEDILRAKFHKDVEVLPRINLQSKKESPTQVFLKLYAQCQKEGLEDMEAYKTAMDRYQSLITNHQKKTKLPDSNDSNIAT